MHFFRFMDSLTGLDGGFWALVVPNKCPTVPSAQTPVTQQLKKVSPSAKNPCVYGTSVDIGDSCAP
jgi:hypothetical protein